MGFQIGTFLSVALSLLVLEILLSVDNALVNVSIARGLPPHQRNSALRTGNLLGAGFRVIALLLASLIIHNVWLITLGALYLIFLMFNHLGSMESKTETEPKKLKSYKKVVMHIAFADIVFSIDNVVSAIGISRNIVYVIAGVLIGIAAILLMSGYFLKILDSFPRLANTGYVIVGFIGVVMLLEESTGRTVGSSTKFLVIVLMVVFTIAYERNAILRRLSGPVLYKLQALLRLPAILLNNLK